MGKYCWHFMTATLSNLLLFIFELLFIMIVTGVTFQLAFTVELCLTITNLICS
jgi:hypothetical protein